MTATAALGAAVLTISFDHHTGLTQFVAVASIAASFCYLMALFRSTNAAQPEDFDVPGNYRANFDDSDINGDTATLLLAQAEIYNRQIDLNTERLKKNSELINEALRWVKFSPVVAFVIGMLSLAFPSSPSPPESPQARAAGQMVVPAKVGP